MDDQQNYDTSRLHELIVGVRGPASICLDVNLAIRWYSQEATQLMLLTEADIGRPIADVTHDLFDCDIAAVAQQALESLVPSEREVTASCDRWILLCSAPFHAQQNLVDGVVITFVDITGWKQAQHRSRILNESLEEQIAQRVRALKLLQDIIQAANEARTVEQAMKETLRQICHYTGWLLGHASVGQEIDGKLLISQHLWHASEEVKCSSQRLDEFQQIAANTKESPDESLAGHVLLTAEPHWIDDVNQFEDSLRDVAASLGIGAAVAFPILTNGDAVAVLEFFSKKPIARDGRFTEFMATAGIQLGHVAKRKQLESAIVNAAASQQSYIGRELHDAVAQELAGVGMMATTLSEALASISSPVADDAARIAKHVRNAHDQVHRLSRGLMPVGVDSRGLVVALEQLADYAAHAHRIRCSVDCDASIEVANSEQATQLYRIAQEAVQNAVKHASPQHVVIRLERGSCEIALKIHNDGEPLPGIISVGGTGLRIMDYRAAMMGGKVEIDSDTESGVTVTCRVPLQ